MINVNFCVMIVLIELDTVIPLSVTLIVFQGHSSVNQFLLKTCSYSFNLSFCTASREIIDLFPRLKNKQKNFALAFCQNKICQTSHDHYFVLESTLSF